MIYEGLNKLSRGQQINLIVDFCVATEAKIDNPSSNESYSIKTTPEDEFKYNLAVFLANNNNVLLEFFDQLKKMYYTHLTKSEKKQTREIFQRHSVTIIDGVKNVKSRRRSTKTN